MKISVITPRFSLAGVPLAQIRFAKSLSDLGHDVVLIIGHINSGYQLPDISGVTTIVLAKERAIYMVTDLVNHLRQRQPDIVFSAEDHLNVIVLISAFISNSHAKISCSSRVTPFDTYSNIVFSKRWVLKQLMKVLMNRATVLTCVSVDMVNQYKKVFNNPPHQCIYNIVKDRESDYKMREELVDVWFNDDIPMIVAAGRLAPWKGFSDLIYAIKEVNKSIEVRLTILGGGPLKEELESQVEGLNLKSSVKLTGYVKNTLKYFNKSDVFVLSSHVEGLPNVLVEAMMCGCTPVATDCPTGPREVLKDGLYGYLTPVGDVLSMAKSIKKALNKPISKEKLMQAVEPFTEYNVLENHCNSLKIPYEDFFKT